MVWEVKVGGRKEGHERRKREGKLAIKSRNNGMVMK